MNELIPIAHPDALHARSVLVALGQGQDIGVTFRNIILSSEEPGITDDINSTSLMKYATLYWPGGNPAHGQQVETIVQGDLPSEAFATEAARVRKLTLSASIGASALARVPDHLRKMWDTVEQFAPDVALESFTEQCKDLRRPFSVLAVSDVTSGDPGRSIMHFWHPAMVHPELCLNELQRVITADGA